LLIMKNFIISCVITVFLLVFVKVASAGMYVSPALIRVNLASGESYNTKIQIQNTSREKSEYVKIYAESSEKNLAGKWKYTKKAGGEMTMLPWVSVTPEILTLAPGAKADFTLNFKIPRQAYGDYRVSLMIAQDPSRMTPEPHEKDVDVSELELGKRRKLRKPQKMTVSMTQYTRIAVPVYVRIMQANAPKKRVALLSKLADLKVDTVHKDEDEGTIRASLIAQNNGNFDLQFSGSCKILHGTTNSLLKIVELSDRKITIMPKSKRLLRFTFSDPLPAGKYIASAKLKMKNRGFENTVTKTVKTRFEIIPKIAKAIEKTSSLRRMDQETPYVPLLIEPGRIDFEFQRKRIKPLKFTILNPTNKTLAVRSIFRSASQSKKSKPSAKITPDRFSIEPGKSERIRVQIKPAGKGPVYGRLLFAVKGMGGSRPAEVPVIILPKGVKLKPSGSIADFEALSVKDGKSVKISGKLKNTGNAHLDDISAEILIKDFLDNPVKKNRASVSRRILFPAEKTRLFSDFSLSDLKDDIYKAVFVVKSKGAKTISNSFRFKVDSESDEVVRLVE